MDLQTVITWIAGVVSVLATAFTGAAGLIFARQEKRIAALEAEMAKLSSEHGDCRVKVATLEMHNKALQGEVDELRAELESLKVQ